MSNETNPSSGDNTPEPYNDNFFPDNVISMRQYLDREVSRRAGRQRRPKEGEMIVRVKDKIEQHKTITIIGTAAAIGLALGGLYAVRKNRQNR